MDSVRNFKVLENLLVDFSNITQLSVNLYNENFETLVHAVHPSPFCWAIHAAADKRGLEHPCNCVGEKFLEKAKHVDTPTSFYCENGLWSVIIPLKKEDKLLGYLMLGHTRRVASYQDTHPRLDWLDREEEEKLNRTFKELLHYNEEKIDSLLRLFSTLLEKPVIEGLIEIKSNGPAQQLIDFVDTHLTEKITTTALCRALGISRSALYDISNRFLGYPIADYIRHRRLQKAKRLLLDSDLSVATVAERCGFSSTIQFDKVMQKYENTSPRLYRNANKSGKKLP